MKKRRARKKSTAVTRQPRVHRVSFMLNGDEYKALMGHFLKYKIDNRSKWYRETIFSHVIRSMEEDYPTLFDENEMRG